ncbi:MAG: long-chain acyl-CoA synthetase [Bacteroidia bacterium]
MYSAEVERVLATQPLVRHAAVLGIDDERLGQCVVAVVELMLGADTSDTLAVRLLEDCAGQLARYKVAGRLRFVETLPRKVIKN